MLLPFLGEERLIYKSGPAREERGVPLSSWNPRGARATLQLDPSHGIFCVVAPHARPPFIAGWSTCLRLSLVPGPHLVSQSLHGPHSAASTQSTAVNQQARMQEMKCGGVFLLKKVEMGCFCKKVDLSSTQGALCTVSVFFILHFTYFGGGCTHPTHPPTYGPDPGADLVG